MTPEKEIYIKKLCKEFRNKLIDILFEIQTGHPGGSLSCVEILATLYFCHMRIDSQNKNMVERDRFILSKGHAAPILYIVLAKLGFIKQDELKTLRQLNSNLQGHPCMSKTPGIELSTGPLGLGLSAGIGMALSAKLLNENYTTYVLLGDGELQEGAIWEAAMTANKYNLSNLVAIIDHNGVQLDGDVGEIMPEECLKDKFSAFGWNVIEANGHDILSFSAALDRAKNSVSKPSVIIAQTVKGKGISFMENKNIWHGRPISKEEYAIAKIELGGGVNG